MPNCKTIAICNQKGGVGKTTTTMNLGIGLANKGKRVLVVDSDPQGDLTTCLGWQRVDEIPVTLATKMHEIIRDNETNPESGILHHNEGVDLIPSASIGLLPIWRRPTQAIMILLYGAGGEPGRGEIPMSLIAVRRLKNFPYRFIYPLGCRGQISGKVT